jgi:hypothetical protein
MESVWGGFVGSKQGLNIKTYVLFLTKIDGYGGEHAFHPYVGGVGANCMFALLHDISLCGSS